MNKLNLEKYYFIGSICDTFVEMSQNYVSDLEKSSWVSFINRLYEEDAPESDQLRFFRVVDFETGEITDTVSIATVINNEYHVYAEAKKGGAINAVNALYRELKISCEFTA